MSAEHRIYSIDPTACFTTSFKNGLASIEKARVLRTGCAIAILGLALLAADAHAQVNSGFIAGNRTVTIPVCTGISNPNNYPSHVHYNVGGSGFYWTVNGNPPPQPGFPQGGDLPNFPPGQTCMDAVVVTSGMPNTTASSGRSIYFVGCIEYPGPPPAPTCNGQTRLYTFLFPTSPTPSVSPSSTILSTGSHPTTVTLNPPLASTRVNASCTNSNGAVVSVIPQTMMTNISGKADFNIVATTLAVPAPPGTPAATCTFSLPEYGNVSASRQARGTIVQPGIQLSTYNIVTGGTQPVTASISPIFSGVTITSTCTTSLATVQVNPANAVTNSSGIATFSLNVSGLVNINPNTSIKPTASCLFKIQNGTGQATLNFSTGNACGFSELQPKPAACGNPT